MKKIIAFHVFLLSAISFFWISKAVWNMPDWIAENYLAIDCILVAILGGVLYCLRAVYRNKCVKNNWDVNWETWYYLRPLTSSISGLAAYIFLKAGLVVLDASQEAESSDYGFLAFAFIAGLNVDKFVLKLEDIAKSVFGIEKSRTAKESEKDN